MSEKFDATVFVSDVFISQGAHCRAEEQRKAEMRAMSILSDSSIPEDLVELAQRCKVEHVMREVWRQAYLAGFRAAVAGVDVTQEVRSG